MNHRVTLVAGLLAALTAPVSAAPDDVDFPEEVDTSKVNTGTLTFLDKPPEKPVHHHHNAIRIEPGSLRDGWVRMDQCHEHLDAVPRAQILYREGHIRALRIESATGIDEARVEGPSVQLRGVGKPARLCVSAETRALRDNGDGSWTLASGPFMRRFLDGYYPMRVSMSVAYPKSLRLVDMSPAAQPGFRVWHEAQTVRIDTWFEGQLRTEIRFEAAARSPVARADGRLVASTAQIAD